MYIEALGDLALFKLSILHARARPFVSCLLKVGELSADIPFDADVNAFTSAPPRTYMNNSFGEQLRILRVPMIHLIFALQMHPRDVVYLKFNNQ